MKIFKKVYIQNIAIILLMLAGVKNILSSLPLHFKAVSIINKYYMYLNHYSDYNYMISGVLSFIIGFLMLVLARRLYKRMFFAWLIEIVILSISIILQVFKHHLILTPVTIIEMIILAILLASYKDFTHKSSRLSLKWGIVLASLSIIILILNSAVGLFILRSHYEGINNLTDSFYQSIQLLFFMDTSVIHFTTRIGKIYADSVITLNWICVIFSFLVILKPLVYNPIVNNIDREKAKRLISLYGQNAMAYLALENDKLYYFGQTVEGVVSFTVISDVAVCCGDMICADKDAYLFLTEFMLFCKQNAWSITLINVTDKFISLYKQVGFGCVNFGEDAMFKLSEYNLNGGKVAKVRAAINHATKMGVTVIEYKPLVCRNYKLEKEIYNVSRLWLSDKKSDELSFMMSNISLDNPLDRRYFIAIDKNNKLLGFMIFLPYNQKKCYIADVTRRLPDAPQGVLEKIFYDAVTKFKEEKIDWVNLGLIPLANAREDDKTLIAGKLFDFIYNNFNNIYGFKSLHHSKKKYNPTEWQARYLVYYPARFTPKIAYAIVKAQNPKGVLNLLSSTRKKSHKSSDDISDILSD